jgi:hypothetical protein
MQSKNITTISIIVGLIILGFVGYMVYNTQRAPDAGNDPLFVASFEDCLQAGYTVTDSDPRRCRTPDGNTYTEEFPNENQNTAVARGGCYIGGCSQQICSDQPDVVSACEYRAEYSCYASAICEPQTGGECGWTESAELAQCIDLKLGEFAK